MPALSDLLKLRDRLKYLAIDNSHDRDLALLEEIGKISDALRDLDTAAITKVLRDSVNFKTNALLQFQESQIARIDRLIDKALHGYRKASREWCHAIEHYDEYQYKEMLDTYYPNDDESMEYIYKITRSTSDWRDISLLYQMNHLSSIHF